MCVIVKDKFYIPYKYKVVYCILGRTGLYFDKKKESLPSLEARDEEFQTKIWQISADLVSL